MSTPNPLIPLSVTTATPVTAQQEARSGQIRNQLLEAQTAGVESRTAGAEEERGVARAARDQRAVLEGQFRNIARGVNELSPLLDAAISSGDTTELIQALETRREGLLADPSTVDTNDTAQTLQMVMSGQLQGVRSQFDEVQETEREFDRVALGLPAARRGELGDPAALRTFEALVDRGELNTEEEKSAARRALGLEAKAGTRTRQERVADDPELAQRVADSEALIAGTKKFEELTAASRASFIDKGFVAITAIDKNLLNLNRATAALEAGATTGEIESLFPSFSEATILLEQVQSELALDVVGATTFGALSKGELDLAQQVALPTGLEPPELLRFLKAKSEAQTKLRGYYSEQIQFLEKPGGSVAGFLRSKESEREGAAAGDLSDEELARQLGL